MSATSAHVFCLCFSVFLFPQYSGGMVPNSISLPWYDSTGDAAVKFARLKAVTSKSKPEEILQHDPNGNWKGSSAMCH